MLSKECPRVPPRRRREYNLNGHDPATIISKIATYDLTPFRGSPKSLTESSIESIEDLNSKVIDAEINDLAGKFQEMLDAPQRTAAYFYECSELFIQKKVDKIRKELGLGPFRGPFQAPVCSFLSNDILSCSS